MPFVRSLASVVVGSGLLIGALSGTSQAQHRSSGAQVCTLGSAAVGQPGTLICKDLQSGATTQSIPLGPTVSAAGGIAASLAGRSDRVLVTNQASGAILFHVGHGFLVNPLALGTGGEGSLSGALGDRGAYVLTGTTLRFFPYGQTTATSARPLLVGDGSAATVTLTRRFAYVSEKNGSLESFALAEDGSLGPAAAVSGVSPGVIVGITGLDQLVVAPIAHLASNAGQSEISVSEGTAQAQRVPTKEVAACWAANDDGEVCVANPGSMTVSCGHTGDDGFLSYTGAAASLPGESVFDLDMGQGLVVLQGINGGAPVLLAFHRTAGDFLTPVTEIPVGTTLAAGALLLPAISR
ncbi:MAG TPA: hypothetical protein VMT03_03495 [Polyangia bacterium]|nr:hypothetical protein [Polyangia bacterium]